MTSVLIGILLLAVAVGLVLRFLSWSMKSVPERVFRDGYLVEPAGHGGGLFYRELEGRLMGFLPGPRGVLLVPSQEHWERNAPAWALGRRTEILGRLKASIPDLSFAEYESDAQQDEWYRRYRQRDDGYPVI
ncbi:MAG: hypothetical protein NTV51_30860 [Verrucomicrobia bacterium]|nr:hypothetical protein [Verrucomicrobiota bacterium]